MPTINVRWADNTAQLRANLKQGIDTIDAMKASVDKTVQALGGQGLYAAANKVTAAIDQLGGATKLTTAEQERAIATLDKAIEKYRLMGQEAPAAMRDLVEQMKQAVTGLDALAAGMTTAGEAASASGQLIAGMSTSGRAAVEDLTNTATTRLSAVSAGARDLRGALIQAFQDPRQAMLDLVAGLERDLVAALSGPVLAAGAIAVAAGAAVATFVEMGESVQDASYKLSDTVENTAALKAAMDVAGGSIDQAANLLFKMDAALQDGGPAADKVEEGLAKIGLSVAQLEALSPTEKFLKIADAFRTNTDETNRAGVAMELFSRQGRDAIPLLMKPLSDLDEEWKQNTLLTTDDAKAAEELAMQWRAVKESMEWMAADTGKAVLFFLTQIRDPLFGKSLANPSSADPLNLQHLVDTMSTAEAAAHGFTPAIQLTAEQLAELGAPQRAATKGFQDLTLTQAQAAALTEGLNAGLKDVPARLHAAEEAARKHKEEMKQANDELAKAIEGYDKLTEATDKWMANSVGGQKVLQNLRMEMMVQSGQAALSSTPLKAPDMNSKGDLLGPFQLDPTKTLMDLDTLQLSKMATDKGEDTGNAFTAAFSSSLSDMPKLIERGLTGGHLKGAFTAVGADAGSKLGKAAKDALINETGNSADGGNLLTHAFGDKIGGAITSALPGIGSLIGPAVSKLFSMIANFGGPSKEELAARDTQSQLIDTLKQMATQGEITEGALTDNYHAIAIVARDAFMTAGESAADAEKDVAALLNTHDPAAFATAMGHVNQVMQANAEHVAFITSGVNNISTAFGRAGAYIPLALRQSLVDLDRMAGLTDDNRKAIEGLINQGTPSFDALMSVAGKYNLTLGQLGSTFAEKGIEEGAKNIYNDFKELTDAGANATSILIGSGNKIYKSFDDLSAAGAQANGVLTGMGQKIQDLVNQSASFGTAIPDNMKPLIQSLIAQGDLYDLNGKKITDMTGIKFEATPLDQGLSDLTAMIKALINTLNGVPNALDAINNTKIDPIHVPVTVDQPDFGNFNPPDSSQPFDPNAGEHGMSTGGWITASGLMQHFARGGIVPPQYLDGGGFASSLYAAPPRLFQPIGTDTVPAMLTPGEMVLTSSQQQAIGGAMGSTTALLAEVKALRADVQRLSAQPTVVQIDGREVVRASNRVLDNGGSLLTDLRDVLGGR